MKIVLVQPGFYDMDPVNMLEHYRKSLVPLRRQEIDLIVFPEFFSTGFYMDFKMPEGAADLTVQWMKTLSSDLQCAVAGSVPIPVSGGKMVNRLYFIAPELQEHYDKRHIFLGPESDCFDAGVRRVIVDYRGMKILLQLCYDMRFPVWSRVRNADYDMILNVAQWPESRIAVPMALCTARAIENQSYYVFCNWKAEIHGEKEGGSSHLVRPDGITQEPDQVFVSPDADLFLYEIQDRLPAFLRKRFRVWRDADEFEIQLKKE